MSKSVDCAIQLGESVNQSFHIKFLDENNEPLPEYYEFAQKAHEELCFIQECLETDQDSTISAEVWAALQLLHPEKEKRLTGIKKSLERLADGTFTFGCEKKQCLCHSNCGGKCDGDIHDRKMARPEATSCAELKTQKERSASM